MLSCSPLFLTLPLHPSRSLVLDVLVFCAVSYLARRELKKQMEENSGAAPADAGEAGEGRLEEEGGGRGAGG